MTSLVDYLKSYKEVHFPFFFLHRLLVHLRGESFVSFQCCSVVHKNKRISIKNL